MGMPIIECTPVDEGCALTAILQSIALQEAGLAHILNAEGEKLQKVVSCANSSQELLEVNEAVTNSLQAIAAIEETLNSKKENSISVIVDVDGFECDFENTLHVDEVKDCYFLESRLFNRKDGSMINSYLELLNTDGSIKEVYVDDIWDYANWEEVR